MNLRDLHLDSPWSLLSLVAVALLVLWEIVKRKKRRQPALRFPALALLEGVPRTFFARIAWLPLALRVAAIALIAIALARPQLVGEPEAEEAEGIDIAVVLDTSCSMQAADFQPQDRMFVAKKSIREFISKRTNDRIALVIFAGEAATWVPLTLDYSLLGQLVEEVNVGMLADGTAIGSAIATALNRLRRSEAKSKAVILITDGDNNAGEISPLAASGFAKDLGVKVYTILIGTGGAVPFPAGKDLFGRMVYKKQIIPTNPELLKKIAAETGGEAFAATNEQELDDRLGEVLDRLEKTRLESAATLRPYAELFPHLVFAAIALLALDLLLGATRFRRYP
jgi:Ca-activated chloride channel homolog